MLEGFGLIRVILIIEDEAYFDDTRETSGHQCISKDGVDHGGEREMLGMSGLNDE